MSWLYVLALSQFSIAAALAIVTIVIYLHKRKIWHIALVGTSYLGLLEMMSACLGRHNNPTWRIVEFLVLCAVGDFAIYLVLMEGFRRDRAERDAC